MSHRQVSCWMAHSWANAVKKTQAAMTAGQSYHIRYLSFWPSRSGEESLCMTSKLVSSRDRELVSRQRRDSSPSPEGPEWQFGRSRAISVSPESCHHQLLSFVAGIHPPNPGMTHVLDW